MQVAVRPRLTAGVALVGASLVVASTVAPVPDVHLPELHLPSIRTAEVDLAAAVNPLEVYSKVLQDALANIGTLTENTHPGQVLSQVLANQLGGVATIGTALGASGGAIGGALAQVPALAQTAIGQLAAGNVSGAADSLAQIPLALGLPIVDLVPALEQLLTKPLETLVNVVNAFTSDTLGTELILSGFIGPLISTPAAAATAVQNVIGAVGTGNPVAVVGALLGAPATVADGLLNGGFGPDLGPLVGSPFPVKAGGLLSSPNLVFNPDGTVFLNTGGPVAALQQVLQKIATALAPEAAVKAAQPDVASIPSAAATTVTLTTGSTAASPPANTTPAAESGTETSASKPEATAEAGAPAAANDAAKSASTTKDSTSKDDSTDAKPTDKGTDVTTGNKVEPKTDSGSEATKSDDASSSTTSGPAETSGTADKGAEKTAGTASHARHAK